MITFAHIVDTLFATGLFINGILIMLQLHKLYKTKNSNNFSVISYLGFTIFTLGMVLHGIFVADFILIFGMGLSLILNLATLLLIVIYRHKSRKNLP